jgi:hypothetical protein
MKAAEPFCDCQGCKDRTKERLRTATDSSARHAIALLKAHIADMDKRAKEVKRGS